VQCNICGEEVDNSEDLAKHMEKMHPSGEPEPEETSKPPAEEDVPPPPIIPPRM
jgi:hypothetical protein